MANCWTPIIGRLPLRFSTSRSSFHTRWRTLPESCKAAVDEVLSFPADAAYPAHCAVNLAGRFCHKGNGCQVHYDMRFDAFANQPKRFGLQQVDIQISRVVGLGLHPGAPYFPAGILKFGADIPPRKTLASCHQDALCHRESGPSRPVSVGRLLPSCGTVPPRLYWRAS